MLMQMRMPTVHACMHCSQRQIICAYAPAGPVLRAAILRKYGKDYDLSIVRREIPGRTLVALNVMWTHLAQQSFPMSEDEYDDKLDTLALYLKSVFLPSVCAATHSS